ncbi:MAG TPA: BrnA antitoxin family protein [Roseiarcus sp.]|nr:BrnA antitoxin family protein [Roseiarcus sp.]
MDQPISGRLITYPTRADLVNLRLDADVLKFFRNVGLGWQTRINETLRKPTGL